MGDTGSEAKLGVVRLAPQIRAVDWSTCVTLPPEQHDARGHEQAAPGKGRAIGMVSCSPPAVFANATIERSTPSREERSRLYSRVSPS